MQLCHTISPSVDYVSECPRPEEFGEDIDGFHGVLVFLVQHKVTEIAAVLRPRVLPGSFNRKIKKEKK